MHSEAAKSNTVREPRGNTQKIWEIQRLNFEQSRNVQSSVELANKQEDLHRQNLNYPRCLFQIHSRDGDRQLGQFLKKN